jgi:DNA uptake protein ComE-like DNA-binding protein
MQKRLQSYISFTRREKTGLSLLLFLLLILIGIKATLHLWVKPHFNRATEEQLQLAWKDFMASQPAISVETIKVNINSADSATLVSLRGIGPVTALKIMEYRKQQPFTKIEELREVGSFSDRTIAELSKSITY